MVGEEIKFEFVDVNFLAGAEFGGGGLKFVNPEEISGEMLNFARAVIFGEFLFVVIKTSGETTFGVFVHFVSADLKFDDVFFWGDDGGMDGLITILLGHSDVIFDTAIKRCVEGVDKTEREITSGNVVDDEAKSEQVVNSVDILVVFGEFFVERIDRFGAARELKVDFFLF